MTRPLFALTTTAALVLSTLAAQASPSFLPTFVFPDQTPKIAVPSTQGFTTLLPGK